MNKNASSSKPKPDSYCPVMEVLCFAPDTSCPYWQGTFCEAEDIMGSYFRQYKESFEEKDE